MYSLVIYWGSCIFSILLSKIKWIISENRKVSLPFLSALPLVIISSIRYDVGTDYFSYRQLFYAFQYGESERYEPIYFLLNYIIGFFTNNPQWIFVASAVIFFACIYNRIFQDSPYPELSIFLLMGTTIFFTYMNDMRQLMGCAICFFSLKYVFEQKKIQFILLVLIAAGFHYSCILFLIVYFFQYVNWGILKSTIALVILYLLSKSILNIALDYLMQTIYAHYFITADLDRFIVFIPINIVVWIFCAFCINKKNNPKYNIYLNSQFAMVAVSMFWGIMPGVNRIMWVFWLPQIILIPIALKETKSWKIRLIFMTVIVISYFIYSSYSISVLNAHSVVPYQTILG